VWELGAILADLVRHHHGDVLERGRIERLGCTRRRTLSGFLELLGCEEIGWPERSAPVHQQTVVEAAHNLLRAIMWTTIANATSANSRTVEPVSAPKNTAIASFPIRLPPCERRQLRRAQRYSARVA
jgi:hypothetical protein